MYKYISKYDVLCIPAYEYNQQLVMLCYGYNNLKMKTLSTFFSVLNFVVLYNSIPMRNYLYIY